MNPKCNLPEARHGEILGRFDGLMTADEERIMRERFPQYLFFRNEYEDDGFHVSSEPIRLCTCTACGDSFEAVRGNYSRGKLHHEKCNCPHCGTRVEGIALRKYKYDMSSLHTWIKTAIARPAGDGGLLVEAGQAVRRFNWDELFGTIDWYPAKRYYFGKSGIEEWKLERYWEGCHCVGHDWVPTKTVGDPFQPNMMGCCDYDGSYSVIGLADALPETDLKYCQIFEFFRRRAEADLDGGETARCIVKYLAWACIHPQIEMAVKLGLEGAVEDLISTGKKNANLLNWMAKRPGELIRMNAQDAKVFFEAGMDISDLEAWNRTGRMRIARFIDLQNQCGGNSGLKDLEGCCRIAGCTPEQGVNYIKGLQPACARYRVESKRIIQIWKDYLNMAKQLDLDLTVRTVAMPRDLKERHDAAAETVRVTANAEEMKRYKTRRRKLEKKYSFSLGDYCIRVPNSSAEIVLEGKTLHHCVGGYAARHISGATTILFLRKKRTPARSFLTVEVYEEGGRVKIRQIHGYRNEAYCGYGIDEKERFGWFLGPWLKWVNSGSKRDRDGKPILPKTITTEVKSA